MMQGECLHIVYCMNGFSYHGFGEMTTKNKVVTIQKYLAGITHALRMTQPQRECQKEIPSYCSNLQNTLFKYRMNIEA